MVKGGSQIAEPEVESQQQTAAILNLKSEEIESKQMPLSEESGKQVSPGLNESPASKRIRKIIAP